MTIKNIFFIAVFIATVLALFINKLTTPRVLSTNELLVNGLFMFEEPKKISDFSFYSANGVNSQKMIYMENGQYVFWFYKMS